MSRAVGKVIVKLKVGETLSLHRVVELSLAASMKGNMGSGYSCPNTNVQNSKQGERFLCFEGRGRGTRRYPACSPCYTGLQD